MSKYYLGYSIQRLGDGLYGMEHIRWGKQLWTLAKMRKEHHCVMADINIPKGAYAYRPITNAGNRYERISKAFFEANS